MELYTLVFDIGKTNKKCLLFDEQFIVQDKVETHLPEITDEDGFPCEDIDLLSKWILDTFDHFHQKHGAKIGFVNFSTYGASFVHLDEKGRVISPLYNYLKPVRDNYFDDFYKKYHGKDYFSKRTASPALDFLNSGLQLLWIKQEKPAVFNRIKSSLHLPNYCGYLFHKKAYSEYTSIGCHTALWDYEKMDYHEWVKKEGILPLLPVITEGTRYLDMKYAGSNLRVGVGLHDSSAALIPYLFGVKERFILISTGTWSITLNPFSKDILTSEELNRDSLQFLRVNGQQVKAARLFLGNEFALQIEKLNKYFKKAKDYFKTIRFQEEKFITFVNTGTKIFHFESLGEKSKGNNQILSCFNSFDEAYYQLNYELVLRQLDAYYLAKGTTEDIQTVFIDGGFSNNEVFCSIFARKLPDISLKKTQLAAGSSLGVAIIMRPELFTQRRFEEILGVEVI